MLRSIKDLIGYPVVALDGKAGKVVDILFGDQHWRMRYLDVETQTGFHLNLHYLTSGLDESTPVTRYLVPPGLLEAPRMGLSRRAIPLMAKRDDIRECPAFSEVRPVEEKYSEEFHRFFRHGVYDDRPIVGSITGIFGYAPPISAYEHSEQEVEEHLQRMKQIAGEHVHSAKAVLGYDVRGDVETLGEVSDLILNVDTWTIAYFVLDTRHGLPSRKYLLPMDKAIELNWSQTALSTKLTKKDIANERRFVPYEPVNHDLADHEYDYYGKPCIKDLMAEMY